MHNYSHYSPTKVIFGKDTVPQLIPELKRDSIQRVLVLTGGKSVYASGLYDAVTGLLTEAGIAFESVSGVQPNPRLSKVREAIAVCKKMNAQGIVPVGGGSVFDSAKAIAAGALSEDDYWAIARGQAPFPSAVLPIYGILTLSGTSSEVNSTGVITNEENQFKCPIANDALIPKVSIVDPSLQYTVPLEQIRHCSVDALSHVLEAYFSSLDTTAVITEHCEAYARGIIRCMRALPEAQNDYNVRSELAFCSVYAHSGWASIGRPKRGDFASHRIGHALSGLFDTPHGVTLGIIMSAWMQYVYNQGLAKDTFARFATHVLGITEAPGGDFALAAVKGFKDLIRAQDMPVSMREVGISEKDIPALAENACMALPFGAVIPMDIKHITEILKLAL